jgi:hypothetical protein
LGWIRIRIRGSMPLTNGSGSGFGSVSWIRILLFSSLTFKMPAKNYFFNTIFSTYYFLKLHLYHFTKITSQKESLNSRNQGFSTYFCMIIEGSGSRAGSGSGSIPLTSGSGWPKNTWIRWIRIRIRIRIRNTDCKIGNKKFLPSPVLLQSPASLTGSLLTAGRVGKNLLKTVPYSVADPDPGSGAFLTPGSGIRDPE